MCIYSEKSTYYFFCVRNFFSVPHILSFRFNDYWLFYFFIHFYYYFLFLKLYVVVNFWSEFSMNLSTIFVLVFSNMILYHCTSGYLENHFILVTHINLNILEGTLNFTFYANLYLETLFVLSISCSIFIYLRMELI